VWNNVVAACPGCNHRKGGRSLEEIHMHLLHLPKEPPASAVYLYGRHLGEYGEWEPFITGW
jgi:5-methylcytosine-specific restriction endonuclease McrA